MPTTRRRTTRARTGTADGVPEEIYQAFTSGFGSLIGLDEGWKKRQTEAELRKAWKKYKDAILARDMAKNKAQDKVARRSWALFEW